MVLEILAVNVTMLVALSLLPRRRAVRPETGRRRAKALLRETGAGRLTLGAILLHAAGGAGRRVGEALDPAALGAGSGWKLAVAGGALAGLGLLLGGAWAAEAGSPDRTAAVACSGGSAESHGHLAGSGHVHAPASVSLHRVPDSRARIPAPTVPAPVLARAGLGHEAAEVEALKERLERTLARVRVMVEASRAAGPGIEALEAELESELGAALAGLAAAAREIGEEEGAAGREALAAKLRLLEL